MDLSVRLRLRYEIWRRPWSVMPDDYRELAAKCRSLAERINDPPTVDVLLRLALEYDEKAASHASDGEGPRPSRGEE